MIVEAPNVDANGGEATFDVSVREGGGAIAAPPPEEAEKRQFRLVFVRFTTRFDAFLAGNSNIFSVSSNLAGNSNRRRSQRRFGRNAYSQRIDVMMNFDVFRSVRHRRNRRNNRHVDVFRNRMECRWIYFRFRRC